MDQHDACCILQLNMTFTSYQQFMAVQYKLSILVYSNPVVPYVSSSFSSPRSFDWLEDKKGSKKTRLPAKQFIDTSLAQIQRQIRDERTFPTKFGRYSTVKLVLFLDPPQNRIGLVSL